MEGSSRNGSGGVNGGVSNGALSRAERFEDEKKRIISSCFEKKDEDGSRKFRENRCRRKVATNISGLKYSNHTSPTSES
jgi:hypothetical protein